MCGKPLLFGSAVIESAFAWLAYLHSPLLASATAVAFLSLCNTVLEGSQFSTSFLNCSIQRLKKKDSGLNGRLL